MNSEPRKQWIEHIHKKIIAPHLLKNQCTLLRQHHTIATINGAFDLLHAGHLYMLFEASKQADLLIVGLNSDLSIHAYKSTKRPIIPLQYRLELVAALECVSFVTWFDETTPCAWLEAIHPHVHVNGSEYGMDCIEKPTLDRMGTRLHLVPRAVGPYLATSSIVKKIESLCD